MADPMKRVQADHLEEYFSEYMNRLVLKCDLEEYSCYEILPMTGRQGRVWNPAFSKCLSNVKAWAIPSFFITANDVQSVKL